jgi:membrane protein CcdC involved in cytochrome C biogenesis
MQNFSFSFASINCEKKSGMIYILLNALLYWIILLEFCYKAKKKKEKKNENYLQNEELM